ncbi:resolvase [Pantoea dispersa]|uniref:resolvase n=1 Tax=Pantoea dispersa TaxID=59814 RepID=UPI0039BDD736
MDRFIPVVFAGLTGENTFHNARQRRLKVWAHQPHEMAQISRSDATSHFLADTGAARYFDYESAVALRNLAAAYGTDMPRYLLAPEVAVLLSKVPDLRKRLFIDALWNTGGRLNEIQPLARENFVLNDPLTGAPLSSPFVVLRTLKQRRLEEAARGRCRSPIRALCSV